MNKKKITILLLPTLALLVLYLSFFRKNSSSLEASKSSFSVPDTGAITKVVLTLYKNQKNTGISTSLERKKKSGGTFWIVNDSFTVQPERIKTFLETIQQVSVRSVLSQAAQNTALEVIKQRHVRVEIYTEKGEEKVYFVGDAADENRGTYMQLKGSAEPFITEIPGFSGILNPRYEPELDTWRENIIFRVSPSRLVEIEVKWPGIDSSYKLIKSSDNTWRLNPSIARPDTFFISRYVQEFRTIYGLAFVSKQQQTEVSKLLLRKPDVMINLTELVSDLSSGEDLAARKTSQKRTISIQLYNRDADTYYALVQGSPEWRVVQKFVLKRILQKRSFFAG